MSEANEDEVGLNFVQGTSATKINLLSLTVLFFIRSER